MLLGPSTAEPSRRLGAYKLVERLHAAGGTELWLATRADRALSGPEEASVRCPAIPGDAAAGARIRREHAALRGLDDARIPKVLSFHESQSALVLEHTRGTTLADIIAAVHHGELVLDATTAVDIILEVAHGLRHAHAIARPEGKLVHGHLGPDQVVLTPEGDVRILGLGVTPKDPDPRTMPPELADGATPDERTDQWQVGALLYHLITRQSLYKGSWTEVWGSASLGDVTPQLDRLEARYPALTQVLRKVLAVQPSARYQVESTFLRALLTASRSVTGKSRRRALGAEAAAITPVRRPVTMPAPANGGLVTHHTGDRPTHSLVFDPGVGVGQSDYELAEQSATESEAISQAWVDLPKADRTPLPDLFSKPAPATVQMPGPVPIPPAVNRPRVPGVRATPVVTTVQRVEPTEPQMIQVVDSIALR